MLYTKQKGDIICTYLRILMKIRCLGGQDDNKVGMIMYVRFGKEQTVNYFNMWNNVGNRIRHISSTMDR